MTYTYIYTYTYTYTHVLFHQQTSCAYRGDENTQGLMDKGLAYEINGSVYFRVSKHTKYGTLVSLDKSGMEASCFL